MILPTAGGVPNLTVNKRDNGFLEIARFSGKNLP